MTFSEYINSHPAPKTQAEWAKEYGMSQSMFSQVRNGLRRPSFDMMVKIERKTRGAVPVSSWAPPAAEDKDAK